MNRVTFRIICLLLGLFMFCAYADNIIFHAGYDGTIKADKALGSQLPVQELKVKYSPGVSGKAVRLAADETIQYQQHRNVNQSHGTVTLWLRPVDWDPSKQSNGYWWMMSIAGNTAEGGHIQIFKMPSPMMMGHVGNYPAPKQITHATSDWQPGEWVFLALVWEKGRMSFYRNGKLLGSTVLEEADVPRDTGKYISLAGGAGITEFDEFTIYNEALSDSEIENLYLANVPGQAGKEVIYRPLLVIGPETGGWHKAAKIEGFLNIPELEMLPGTSLSAQYGKDNIRFRLETPLEAAPDGTTWQAPEEVSLQTLWSVPSAEVLLRPDLSEQGSTYQLAFNIFGQSMSFIDAKPKHWEAAVTSRLENGRWSAEITIPYSSLNTKAPTPGTVWHLNAGRNFLNPAFFSNPALSLAYGDDANAWELVFGSKPARTYTLHVSDTGTVSAKALNGIPATAPAKIYFKKLASEMLHLNSVLSKPEIAPGLVIARDTAMPFRLPGPGRYAAVITGTDASGKVNFRQLFHFQQRKPFDIHCEFFSKQKKMALVWSLNIPAKESMQVHGVIRDSHGNVLAENNGRVQPGMRSGRIEFSMEGWKALDCQAELTMTSPNHTETRQIAFQCFYNAPWIGFEKRLNLSGKLPAPWTPLQVDKRTLTTLAQTYILSEAGLPEKIVAGGAQILAAPVQMTLPGFRLTREMHFTHQDEQSAEWESTFDSDSMKVVLKGRAEFDGMLRYDLTLIPKSGTASLKDMRLMIPVNSGNGSFFLPYSGPYQKWNVLDIPTDARKPYSDAFMPHLWLGDAVRGIAWFAETDEFFRPADESKVVNITPGAQMTTMMIDMVSRPLELQNPLTYTFGLQATPAKPFPKNWGSYHLAGCDSTPRKPVVTMGYTTGLEYHKYAGLPYPCKDDNRALEYIQANRGNSGIHTLIYTTSNGVGSKCPEFQFFEEEWKNPLFCDTWTMAARGEYHWGVNPSSQTWRDFYLYSVQRAIDAFGPSGFYYDFGSVIQSDNASAGNGYLRNGKRRPTWPIFADRAIRRAVYQMVQEKNNGEATFVSHNYSQVMAPLTSFFTMLLDGEPYQQRTGVIGVKITTDYTKLIPLSRLKTMFGFQFGTIPCILVKLPIDSADSEEIRKATRTALALTAPHGIPIWGFYCDIQELNRLLHIQDEFDLADAHFVPYYAENCALKLLPGAGENVLLSYWEKTDGRKLAVVGNLTDKIYRGKIVSPNGGEKFIEVPPKDYTAFEMP